MTVTKLPWLCLMLLLSLVMSQLLTVICTGTLAQFSNTQPSESDEKETSEKEVLVQTVSRQVPRVTERLVKQLPARPFRCQLHRVMQTKALLSPANDLLVVLRC